jgi:hypothetical protein
MSVTSPTLKLLALDEPELAVLLDPLAELPPELLLLLLLLPHATSPRASATAAIARRPTGLILPFTASPFLHDRMGNHIPCAGPSGDSPNVPFTR